MAKAKQATRKSAKTSPKTRLTKKVLRVASSKATAKAHREAFAHLKTHLIAKDGWLVRVNADGQVTEKVKALMSPKLKKLARRA